MPTRSMPPAPHRLLLLPFLPQDEVFHVPQTQRYCLGDFSHWDEKITTFPGLYFLGAAAGRAAHYAASALGFGNGMQLCGVAVLRGVNLVISAAALPLYYYIAQALDSSRTHEDLMLLVRPRSCTCGYVCVSFGWLVDMGCSRSSDAPPS
jgi:hypothetical protein